MKHVFLIGMWLACHCATMGQSRPLHELQQAFEDLQFGMFTHYAIPTYQEADWSDPEQSPEIIDAPRLDCRQWARAAKSAHMQFGVLSVKHHNGLCMWDTKTTDYSVMHSRLGRDVVGEYCQAFRREGLKVMFHFSILDTHHRLRPHLITPELVEMTKRQLTELLTQYGEVTAIIFDGWEAPWGRISYDDVPFTEIYRLIKSLQPNCLVIDMNSHKYPREALFYGDIKFYEQGAGQKIDAATNRLPAMACLPMQRTWFWKESMPADTLLDARQFVENTLVPYNQAHCSFVLNAAPNRDGLIDANALRVLREIGRLWKPAPHIALPECEAPVVQRNVARHKPSFSTWSDDMMIMDLANDDDFHSAWRSSPAVQQPQWEVDLQQDFRIDMVVLTEPQNGRVQEYRIEGLAPDGSWQTLFEGSAPTQSRVKIHRFSPVYASRVRVSILRSDGAPAIAELGVYEAL